MKISLDWLSDHVDLSGIDPEELKDMLTMSTAEVERIELIDGGMTDVVTARVLKVSPHPNADKLVLADLDDGSAECRVVCGAPNVREGQLVPLARVGGTLPDSTRIKRAKIRGEESRGMICSERELNLGDGQEGIMVLADDIATGKSVAEVLGLTDHVLEFDNKSLTHRPDLWGHYGIAREVAAVTGRTLGPCPGLDPAITTPDEETTALTVGILDTDLCPRYCAAVLDHLSIEPSPAWMTRRLEAVGVRALSNVVDVTNYVMLELGQPLHAFDLERIRERTILIRRAAAGERITTLDDVDRPLAEDMLVIADSRDPVAVAGVMGGAASEVTAETAAMVLESANFNPTSVRRTSDRLGMRTEAVMRFEKSLDPELPPVAARRFIELARKVIPGIRLVSPFYDVDHHRPASTTIFLGYDFLTRRLGTEISSERASHILKSLSFGLENATKDQSEGVGWNVTIPSFRATKDVSIPEDLVEEVGRIYGYDNIPDQAPTISAVPPTRPPMRILEDRLKDILSLSLGFTEVYRYSFLHREMAEKLELDTGRHLKLRNPLSNDETVLRRSLVPGILQAVMTNCRNRPQHRLYEVGRIYLGDSEGDPDGSEGRLPRENRRVCGAVYDTDSSGEEGVMFYRVKGAVEDLLARLRITGVRPAGANEDERPDWLHPVNGALLHQKIGCLGLIGEIHPRVLKRLDLEGIVGIFDLDLDQLHQCQARPLSYTPIPRYPGVRFDLSVVVPARTEMRTVDDTIRSANTALIREVRLVDVYRGDPIPETMKSLLFKIECRSDKKTLSPEQASRIHQSVIEAVRKSGWTVRD